MVDAGLTAIAAVVAPVLQAYEVPAVPVNVVLAPLQMMPSLFAVPEVSTTVIPGVGFRFTVIVVIIVAEQLFAFVTVTVYVVVDAGLTVTATVVAPVLHA